jgi:UDP-2,4-diacetamido-2,4,6-trideoxy-beta-L-altropyranose hydrolase
MVVIQEAVMGLAALFRCDASLSVGSGHVMRCLAFAQRLNWIGWPCVFATGTDSLNAVPALAQSGHRLQIVEKSDDIGGDLDFGLIVVDHYALAADFEKRVASRAACTMVFDDFPTRKHSCDILVDPTPGRKGTDYAEWVAPATHLLLGPQYAVIRREWRLQRAARRVRERTRNPVRRIIVTMGATDPCRATERVLHALAVSGIDADIDVVVGVAAANVEPITSLLGPRAKLHIDPPDLPELTARADFAIGTAGSSSFERAVVGLPALLVPVADNQRCIAAAFAHAGAADVVSTELLDEPVALGKRLARIISDEARCEAMSRAAASLTDGHGTQRLLAAMAGTLPSKSGVRVGLRLIEDNDEDWLLNLQRQPATRRFARNATIPTTKEHKAWFRRVLDDDDRLLLVIEVNGEAVGMVRLDKIGERPTAFEISIAVDSARHGQGFGRAALALVRRLAPNADLAATVYPQNRGSLALFAAAGFRPEGPDRYWSRAA